MIISSTREAPKKDHLLTVQKNRFVATDDTGIA